MAGKKLAVDVMSGDFGPHVLVPATIDYLCDNAAMSVLLVGNESLISPLIPKKYSSRVTIVHADEVVAMDEKISVALRSKKILQCVWRWIW